VCQHVKRTEPKHSEAEIKSKVIESLKNRRVRLVFKKIKIGDKYLAYDPEYKYLINEVTKKVYGKLSETKEILPLSDKDRKFLDDGDVPFQDDNDEKSSDEPSEAESSEEKDSKSPKSSMSSDDSSNSDESSSSELEIEED